LQTQFLERSFSAQNFIHNAVRNRLEQEKVDKLAFVYFNSRVLKSMPMMEWEESEEESDSIVEVAGEESEQESEVDMMEG
jgi:hypothetical protein